MQRWKFMLYVISRPHIAHTTMCHAPKTDGPTSRNVELILSDISENSIIDFLNTYQNHQHPFVVNNDDLFVLFSPNKNSTDVHIIDKVLEVQYQIAFGNNMIELDKVTKRFANKHLRYMVLDENFNELY